MVKNKKAYIVLGLGYGDEGKGLTTDYLCSIAKNPIVIRFNGGHQAGHTVLFEGRRHVFSHIGAGTLRGTPTYWSEYCTFSPSALNYELNKLNESGVIYVNNRCPVVTHYDWLFNRCLEDYRSESRHGSCGEGIGATYERNEIKDLKFIVEDLKDKSFCISQLRKIREYYHVRMNELGISFEEYDHEKEDHMFFSEIEKLNELINFKLIKVITSEKFSDIISNWSTFIFEGAQGILLDQKHGEFPYVTRSYTTSSNAINLVERFISGAEIEIVYVTRAYHTRHGNGVFKEDNDVIKKNFNLETNINNHYQGRFKKSYLDINLLNKALEIDSKYSKNYVKNLMITCLDQIGEKLVCRYNSELITITPDFLPELLDSNFKTIWVSYGPTSDTVTNL